MQHTGSDLLFCLILTVGVLLEDIDYLLDGFFFLAFFSIEHLLEDLVGSRLYVSVGADASLSLLGELLDDV
jgi:hypothetical protein